MFSLIFKTIEDDASASSIRITSIFSTLRDNIKLLLSKAATESSFSFEDGFEESLNNDLAAINNYITAVQGGMSEAEALASSFGDASAAAKDYANSTKFAEVNTEDYTIKAKLSQISTLAQNKSLSNTKKLIDEYGTGLKKCGLSQEQYLLEIKKTNPQLAAYLANLHGADATLKGYIGSLFSAKAATIALQIATTALNAVIGMGIGLLLSLIASGLSALFDSIKEALRDPKKVIEELDEELSSLQSTIQSTAKDFSDLKKGSDEIIPRFAELCKGVDEFGNRLTDANGKMILTDEEYEEFWELNNKIAEMFPDLDVGIDSNGNHILSLSYSVDTLTESLEALVEAERQAANQKIIENLDDTLENIEEAEKAYKKETTMTTGKSNHLTSAYNIVKSYGNTGFSWNTSWNISGQSYGNKDRDKAKAYKDALDALGIKYTVSRSGYNPTTRMYDIENIIPDDADWDRIQREYEDALSGFSKEVEDINAKAAARWKKLNPIMGAWLQTTDSYAIATDEIQNLLSKVIGNINYGDIGITDGDDLKEYLQDNVIDTLMDASPDVQDAVKQLFLNDGELSINEFESLANKIKEQFGEDNPVYLYVKTNLDNADEMASTVKSFIKDEFDDQVDDLSIDDLGIASSDEFWKFLGVPDGTLLSWNELCASIKRFKKESSGINPLEITAEDTVKNLNDLSKGFEQLDKIYKDVIDGNGFDVSLIADNKDFEDKFSGLDSYTDFLATIVKYPNDIKKCQDAFNQLTNEYIRNSGVLDTLNEDNKEFVANYLKALGVENADLIVNEQLALSKRQSAIEKEKDRIETVLGTDATAESILAKSNEINATGETAAAYAQLAIEKMLANDESIQTSKDIEALENLANTANASAASLAKVAEYKKLMAEADKYMDYLNSATDPRGRSAAMSQYTYYLNKAKEKLDGGLDYNEVDFSKYKSNYLGSDKTEKEDAKEETWFEKQYNLHKHLVAMEQETDEEYFKWLSSAYKQAYSEGILELDEYRKYEEEVFHGIQDIQAAILESAEDAFNTAKDAYDKLTSAAKEYAETGFLSVDTFESILSLGTKYLSYIYDESGAIKFDEEAVRNLVAAKIDDLAVTKAMNLVDTIKQHINNAEALNELADATYSATDATWRLVYAELASQNLSPELYNAFLNQINMIRSLADSAKTNIGRSSSELSDYYSEAEDALKSILDYTEDLIKYETEQKIDALDKQIDAYQEIIDLKKKALESSKKEKDYEDEVAEKVKEIAKLQSRIDQLSLDDSREAQAERAGLLDELYEKQKDLSDYQADYAYDKQTEALDDELDAYEKAKEKEKDILEESISSAEKLYRLAIDRIDNCWDTLYDDLISWNTEAGNSINEEITKAWDNAAEAVKRYGSYASALSAVTDKSGELTGTTISDLNTNDSVVQNYVDMMRANAQKWHSVSQDQQLALKEQNIWLADRISKITGEELHRDHDGVWWIGSRKLFDVYPEKHHSGGIVGNNPSAKQNEVLTILEKGEAVLDRTKEEGLYKIVDIFEFMSEKLGKAITKSSLESLTAGLGIMSSPLVNVPDSTKAINNNSAYFSPSIVVNITHSGTLSENDAHKYGYAAANEALSVLQSQFQKRGYTNLGIAALKQ